MRMMILFLAIGLTWISAVWAQGQPVREPPGGGPWNNDVLVYRVSPNGEVTKIATFERAGVATITRMKDGRLIAAHQYFPENNDADFDKVAVRFSPDEGQNWTAPQAIRVEGLPEGMRFPFDPTLVPLPDGRVRLYFTGNMGRTFHRSTPAIHSAISTDGVNYTYEPGVRFAVKGRMVIDCAVVLHNGMFHLYAPDNGVQMEPGRPTRNHAAADRPREGVGYHATSEDGLNFTPVDDVQIEGRRRWLGNAQSDGKSITFSGTGPGGVWMGVSSNGREFTLVPTPPIPVADPGAVAAREGGWIVVGTGPPVRGRRGTEGRPALGPPPLRSEGARPPGRPPLDR
ncbi:MAG: exo-alpha-sialidase [Planctomycetota bacterium]